MPTRDEIIQKHAENAKAEIEAEERKSTEEKRAEALNVELGSVSAQMADFQKFPSRYRAELAQLTARQEQIWAELESLGATQKAYQPVGNGSVTFISGGTHSDYSRSR